MLIWQIWEDYLSKTMPVLDSGMLPALLQMGIGAVLPVLTLFRIVRRKNKAEIVVFCMIPCVLIVTTAIVEPLFFGSFLGGGFSAEKLLLLREFLWQPEFFSESLAVCAVFFVCSVLFLLLDHFVGKTSFLKILINMGAEYAFAVVVFAVCRDYFFGEGTLFLSLSDREIKWYLYGLYLLLCKSAFYLLCLMFALLFGERRRAYAFGRYSDPGQWVRSYFAESFRVIGTALLLTAVFWLFVFTWQLFEEGSDTAGYVSAVVVALIAAAGLFFLFYALFPGLWPNCKRIAEWGHPEQMAALLYRELEEQEPLLKLPGGHGFVTHHFIVLNLPRRIYYRPLYEGTRGGADSTCRLYFKDGSHFRISRGEAEQIQAFLNNRR